MTTSDKARQVVPPVLSADEIETVRAAQRCIVEALDHPRAARIVLTSESETAPRIRLPPKTLRLIGQVLGMMAEGRTIVLFPTDQEFSTVEAANLLNVSRPFIVKEIDSGRLKCHKVGTHRRIAYEDLAAYCDAAKHQRHKALDRLAEINKELDLEY